MHTDQVVLLSSCCTLEISLTKLFCQPCMFSLQKLQSFHKAKEYRGSPKKLDSLRDHRLTFDPRPAQYRNQSAYPYHFRSTVLNYCGPKPNIPLRQLYPPANLYAVENDHDYVSSAAENLITDLQVCCSDVYSM